MNSANSDLQKLIDDLRAPIKSFRIFALEEVIRLGDSPLLISVLQDLIENETDQECQVLLTHALAAVRERLGETQPLPQSPIPADEASFKETWCGLSDTERLNLLQRLPPRLPKHLRLLGPALLAEETAPLVAAKIIRLFASYWPKGNFSDIVRLVQSPSLTLQLATLRTLVHAAPALLLPSLPALLQSSDPQIKALAIRGLVKIDQVEALAHLQGLLLSTDPIQRLAGIQNCPFLPFEIVKPVLFKFVAAENQTDLLVRAGWIFEMNPDVRVPFQLYEIAERAPADKAQIVKRILQNAVLRLDQSRLLGDSFAEYLQKLQSWVHRRQAVRTVTSLLARLGHGKAPPPGFAEQVKRLLLQEPIRQALEESLAWPVEEPVKELIRQLLAESRHTSTSASTDSTAPVPTRQPIQDQPQVKVEQRTAPPQRRAQDHGPRPTEHGKQAGRTTLTPLARPTEQQTSQEPTEPTASTKSADLPKPAGLLQTPRLPTQPEKTEPMAGSTRETQEKSVPDAMGSDLEPSAASTAPPASPHQSLLDEMSTWTPDHLVRVGPRLERMFVDSTTSNEVLQAILQTARRIDFRGLKSKCERFMHHADPGVTAALIEYLGHIDPDAVFPYLGRFLKHQDQRVKGTALRLLMANDYQQGSSALRSMLKNRDIEQQRFALACMSEFDFALIRDPLTEFLTTPPDDTLLQRGLFLFAANPEPENLYCLLSIEKILSTEKRAGVRQLREQCRKTLMESGQQGADPEWSEETLERRYAEEQTRRKTARPAYAYRAPIADNEPSSRAQLAAILQWIRDIVVGKATAIVVVLLIVAVGGFRILFMPVTKTKTIAPGGEALLAMPYDVTGKVVDTNKDGLIIDAQEQGKYLVFPGREGFFQARVGDRVTMQVVPYRKLPDGVCLARLRTFRPVSD